jgi:hypothetical protein
MMRLRVWRTLLRKPWAAGLGVVVSSLMGGTMDVQQNHWEVLVKQHELIFVGVVLELGEPPTHWSGRVTAYQRVRYRVERTVYGEWSAPEIDVEHVVVRRSATAEPGQQPSLSFKLYGIGSKLIVSAVRARDGRWRSLSERFGALPYSKETLAELQAEL